MVIKPALQKEYPPIDPKTEGTFMRIAADKLVIPTDGQDAYQRAGVWKHVAKIADDFRWAPFGAIDVVKRLDLGGEYQVVDGGHRLRAALWRGISKVPCMVYPARSAEEAAKIFDDINTLRKNLKFEDRHRALLVANDEVHRRVKAKYDELNGFASFNAKKTLAPICAKPEQFIILNKLMPTLKKLASYSSNGAINGELIKAMVMLEGSLPPSNSLLQPKWQKKMKSKTLAVLNDFSGVGSGRHPKKFAQLLAAKLNMKPNPFDD